MDCLVFKMLLGHLFGDYIFQNNWMALNKTKKWWICAIHSLIYTICICLFLWKFTPLLFGLIFLTHFPLDYYSLGQKWLDLIGGRSFISEYNDDGPYKEIRVAFSTIVYVVVDNSYEFYIKISNSFFAESDTIFS